MNGRKGEERMRKGVVEGDSPDHGQASVCHTFFLGPEGPLVSKDTKARVGWPSTVELRVSDRLSLTVHTLVLALSSDLYPVRQVLLAPFYR